MSVAETAPSYCHVVMFDFMHPLGNRLELVCAVILLSSSHGLTWQLAEFRTGVLSRSALIKCGACCSESWRSVVRQNVTVADAEQGMWDVAAHPQAVKPNGGRACNLPVTSCLAKEG